MIFGFLFFLLINACASASPTPSSSQTASCEAVIFSPPPFITIPQSGVSLVIGYTGKNLTLHDQFSPPEAELLCQTTPEEIFFKTFPKVITVDFKPVERPLGPHMQVNITDKNCFDNLTVILSELGETEVSAVYIAHIQSWSIEQCLKRIAELVTKGLIKPNAQIFCDFYFDPCSRLDPLPIFRTSLNKEQNCFTRHLDYCSIEVMLTQIERSVFQTAQALNIDPKIVRSNIKDLLNYPVEVQFKEAFLFMQFLCANINNIGFPVFFSSVPNPVNGRSNTFWIYLTGDECLNFITSHNNATHVLVIEEDEKKRLKTQKEQELKGLLQTYLIKFLEEPDTLTPKEKKERQEELQKRYQRLLHDISAHITANCQRPRGG